jgi:hypothetical protein
VELRDTAYPEQWLLEYVRSCGFAVSSFLELSLVLHQIEAILSQIKALLISRCKAVCGMRSKDKDFRMHLSDVGDWPF